MTLHEVSSRIRAAGGEILVINTEKGTSVIYAAFINQKHRFIVPRTGQFTSVNTSAVGFITHVITDAASLSWLPASCINQPREYDEDDYDDLPFGPVPTNPA